MASKHTDQLVAKLRRQGATVEKRGMRWRVTQPGNGMAFLPTADPTSRRALGNKVAELRQKGYQV
ncbi:hypothetical protein PV518_51895 [Streptomyces sp. ND04-05B]|uniref:hypothetical protein n=1 Tax=Streptomyces sp. ND04-05B TaxID=3028693 RepID=UPI0029B2FBD1|nr:hypothetical protein [Streptomyces sp. ND04-05B]MDX3070528.1 hypothetical protein [Streptomyces sp. ND04-05B]